jgi:Mg-chelatase subunit ChlD
MGNAQTTEALADPTSNDVDTPPTTHSQHETSAEQPLSSNGVSMKISTEYSKYSSNSSSNTLVGVNLVAPPAPSNTDRAPVDCVVVSDVSGSMMGPKMDLLRETGKLLLNEFVEKDRVGLVTFDSDVKERFPLQSINEASRTKATKIVDSFGAGSLTNLSGGLFAGINQLINDKNADKSHVRTVLLMTDGQANHGLQTAAELIPVITEMLQDTGIALHTFGYGSDHDSDLLRKIATAGNGSYYFVEGVDDIRSAFGDCLGGMLSVVAQNLEVELEAVNGATITKVHHKKAVLVEANKKYRVPFADLYGDEQRDIVVGMCLKPCNEDQNEAGAPSAQILRATLRYIDVIAAMPSETSSVIGVLRANNFSKEESMRNPKLDLQATRLLVADNIEEARTTGEQGDLKKARQIIETTRTEVKAAALRCQGVEGAQESFEAFENDLQDCADGLVDHNAFRSAQYKMTYMAEGHQQQRCMESTIAVDMSSGSSKLRSNAYRTKTKGGMASKFAGIY